jgi:hypothetical protein
MFGLSVLAISISLVGFSKAHESQQHREEGERADQDEEAPEANDNGRPLPECPGTVPDYSR